MDLTASDRAACLAALDALNRCRMHVSAGLIEPTPAQLVELCDLVMAVQTATSETIATTVAQVEAFMLRVCPAAREVC